MERLEATFRIVTPMFLGGAEHEAISIRPPSVKGMMRFWWRALNWGRCRTGVTDDNEALKKLHDEEKKLFGSAAEEENGNQIGGQGCFLLTVKHGNLATTNNNAVHDHLKPTRIITRNGRKNHWAAARYLGYGVIEAFSRSTRNIAAGQLIRSCINENQTFTISLLFKNKIEDSIVHAVKAMGLLGGLGSRTRRGMGSIALETIKSNKSNGQPLWVKPINIEQYKEAIKELFKAPYAIAGIPKPPYSAFFMDARIDCLVTGNSAYDVLNQLGNAMLMYRSWGRTDNAGVPRVLGIPSEKNFDDDHKWLRVAGWRTTNPNFHPERVVFGLPHDYGRDDDKKIKAENHDRRSSPLLFHVHQFNNTEFIGVSIYLPSQFLPSGEKVKAGVKDVPANIDYSVITDFIDGKDRKSPNVITNRFSARQVIIP